MFSKQTFARIFFIVVVVFSCICEKSYATHLRAADMYAKRIDNFTFEFTLTIFSKPGAVTVFPLDEAVQISDGTKYSFQGVGDTAPHIQSISQGPFGSGGSVLRTIIVFRHTFASAGKSYTVKYVDENRNADIENIKGSVNIPFQIEYQFFLFSSDTDLNTSPILTYAPIDDAIIGQTYYHNPGAYDPDGDSISFVLSTPRGKNGTPLQSVFSFDNLTANQTGYMYPHIVANGYLAGRTFTLDPIRGDMVWDYPIVEGEYNVAFVVEEWRNGVRLSRTLRDMQIFVEPGLNKSPILYVPKDTCIAATKDLFATIAAKDPDGISVSLSRFGQVFNIPNPAAFVLETGLPSDTAAGTFFWNPNCNQIQRQPYQAQFRASDTYTGEPNLTTIETWLINVNGPAPENLTATTAGNDVALSWDLYECNNASTISIYRIECDTSLIERSACETGVPPEWGFVKIGEVPAGQTFFLDNNGGVPFKSGIQYHYLIAANFLSVQGGESYASNVATIEFGFDRPVITRVSVNVTDTSMGEIELVIKAPTGLDMGLNPPPYTYEIYREEGFTTPTFSTPPIYSYNQSTLKDTTYLDTGLNTKDTSYTYSMRFYSDGNLVGEFIKSTSTWLKATPGVGSITLSWEEESPWFYVDSLYHVIRADTNGTLFKLDSVPGTQTSYTLNGLTPYDTVCFSVETKGVFCSQILTGVSVNNTQEKCAFAYDNIPPCSPIAAIEDCSTYDNFAPLENNISWKFPSGCADEDLVGFNIYARRVNNPNYILLTRINDPDARAYVHEDINTLTYCYVVKAVDLSNNESESDLEVCGDNCEYFELPNVFTPNNDNKNENFTPFPIPKAVEQIDFQVFNRWGKLVYTAENLTSLEWNGTSSDGSALSSGTYYYAARVLFDKLNPEDRIKEYKGWIQLIRD